MMDILTYVNLAWKQQKWKNSGFDIVILIWKRQNYNAVQKLKAISSILYTKNSDNTVVLAGFKSISWSSFDAISIFFYNILYFFGSYNVNSQFFGDILQ